MVIIKMTLHLTVHKIGRQLSEADDVLRCTLCQSLFLTYAQCQ